jgi:hypothetical protein
VVQLTSQLYVTKNGESLVGPPVVESTHTVVSLFADKVPSTVRPSGVKYS